LRLKVDFELAASSEGGENGHITADYRPDWATGHVDSAGTADYHGAVVEWLAVPKLEPGQRALAVLRTFWPDGRGWTHLRVGDRLTALEGPRIVGSATVVELLDDPRSRDIARR
jgi:hypothetical protein